MKVEKHRILKFREMVEYCSVELVNLPGFKVEVVVID